MSDIFVLVILVFAAYIGFKTGFVRAVFRFGHYIISIGCAMLLYPYLSKLLADSALRAVIRDKFIAPRLAAKTGGINLPPVLQDPLQQGVNAASQSLADAMTNIVMGIICFLLIMIIVSIGLKLVVGMLDTVAKLPVIRLFNKVGGLAMGFVNGIFVVYLILAVTAVFMNDKLYAFISDSKYAIMMYNNNLLLKLIFG